MEYSDIAKYIGRTVEVRYIKDMKFFLRQKDKQGNEFYTDVIKEVPSVLNGIAKACTDQIFILELMDDEQDIEVYIKMKKIQRITPAKVTYFK